MNRTSVFFGVVLLQLVAQGRAFAQTPPTQPPATPPAVPTPAPTSDAGTTTPTAPSSNAPVPIEAVQAVLQQMQTLLQRAAATGGVGTGGVSVAVGNVTINVPSGSGTGGSPSVPPGTPTAPTPVAPAAGPDLETRIRRGASRIRALERGQADLRTRADAQAEQLRLISAALDAAMPALRGDTTLFQRAQRLAATVHGLSVGLQALESWVGGCTAGVDDGCTETHNGVEGRLSVINSAAQMALRSVNTLRTDMTNRVVELEGQVRNHDARIRRLEEAQRRGEDHRTSMRVGAQVGGLLLGNGNTAMSLAATLGFCGGLSASAQLCVDAAAGVANFNGRGGLTGSVSPTVSFRLRDGGWARVYAGAVLQSFTAPFGDNPGGRNLWGIGFGAVAGGMIPLGSDRLYFMPEASLHYATSWGGQTPEQGMAVGLAAKIVAVF